MYTHDAPLNKKHHYSSDVFRFLFLYAPLNARLLHPSFAFFARSTFLITKREQFQPQLRSFSLDFLQMMSDYRQHTLSKKSSLLSPARKSTRLNSSHVATS